MICYMIIIFLTICPFVCVILIRMYYNYMGTMQTVYLSSCYVMINNDMLELNV
jgi:hypothetical protein